MSNLKLPTMTYLNLTRLLGKKNFVKLAYATTAERRGESIAVFQHDNLIAEFNHDSVYLTNAGWHSTTTATRLRKIFQDNHSTYSVRIRDYRMRLLDDGKEMPAEFHSITI